MVSEQSPTLIVREGPAPDTTYTLTSETAVIGRRETADFVIPFQAVSSQHARLTQQDGEVVLEDLNSSNGTFVNGERLNGRRVLKHGDSIQLGQSVRLEYVAPVLPDVTMPEQPAFPDATVVERVAVAPSVAVTVPHQDVTPRLDDKPPMLEVAVAGNAPQSYKLTKEQYSIGRSSDNDIVINSPIVSRYHARIFRGVDSYFLTPIPEAGNPVLFEGRPLTEKRALVDGDLFRIGSQDPGVLVSLSYKTAQAAPEDIDIIDFKSRTSLTIGRDDTSDVRLDDPVVSRYHAQIEKVGARFRVLDLRSSNGTFVNDEPVDGERWLQADDQIRIGSYRFVVGEESLSQHDESNNLRIEAIGLNKWVRKDLNILQDISLVFQPREFIVVVGQSGGGKSTLVDSIAGYRPATHGQVLVNGIDVYKNFDAVRHHVGFVPQKDIIHMELTVYQALDYAARLRMPPDTTKQERHQRILEVLDDLDLTHRQDVQISGLSGGQQKRVSIGVELLTKPGLFFLDEPTSGLDPGTETALMQLMRRLADQGRTITLITHATKNVVLADKVVFLARGGYLVWFGPPDEALEYFDQYRSERARRAHRMEFDEIYGVLDDASKGSPEEWAERFRNHEAHQKYVVQPLQRRGHAPSGKAVEVKTAETKKPRQVSGWRQFLTLSGRNIKILTRDRFGLILMLAAAPIVSLLDVVLSVVVGRTPLDFTNGAIRDVLITYFLLTIYGVMVGGLAQMREIVKEQDIYKRERLVNLKILPYIMSKIWVAALLALYQALVYTGVHYLAFEVPGGALEFGIIYVTLTLATMAGMMLGLFASALAPSPNAAPLIVILLMLPQIVLGGVLVPMSRNISGITATHWAFQGFMAAVGFGNDVVNDPCWALPEEQLDLLTLEQKDEQCRCRGTNTVREDSCNMPGLGMFYNPAIDQPAPQEPPPLRDEPPRPDVPPQPEEPADQSNQVAVAEYLEALQEWQAEAEAIQAGYEAEIEAFRTEGEVYQTEVIAYQTELAEWQIARASASEAAEGVIAMFNRDVPWSFVNKEDPQAWWAQIFQAWLAELAIIGVLFVGILILQKRKDIS